MSSTVNNIPYGQTGSALGWTRSAVSPKHFIYKPKQKFIQNWLLDELGTPDDYLPISLSGLDIPNEYGANNADLNQKQQCTQQYGGPSKKSNVDNISQLITQASVATDQGAKPRRGRPKQKQVDKILEHKSHHGCPKKQKEDLNPELLSHPDLPNDLCSKPRRGLPMHEKEDQCTKEPPGPAKQNIDNSLTKIIGPQKFQCNLCDHKSTTKGNLKVHMRVHTREKPYNCQHCDRSLTSKINLNKHMLAHHVLKEHHDVKSIKSTRISQKSECTTIAQPFICHLCGCQFTSSDFLNSHVTQCRLMVYDKLTKCTSQPPGLPNQDIDNSLMKSIGPQKFQCDFCDHKSTTKGNLKVHMRVHTREKPYNCQHCDRSFTSKINLNKHMLAHHVLKERHDVKSIKSNRSSQNSECTMIVQPFICHLCGCQFTSSNILSSHVTQCRLVIYGNLIK